jgi:orotidine-5'-phosphate decarboxylase
VPIPERLKPKFAAETSATTDKLSEARLSQARERLIVALDVPTAEAAMRLVKKLNGACTWFKVGMELFTAAGPSVVEKLAGGGHSVFLDLKFHDIPNTVAGAVRSAAKLGARMITLHAAGGPAMLASARDALSGVADPPQLLAVTVLTSIDDAQLKATGIARTPAQQVEILAKMGLVAGIRGFVCSPEEVSALRALTGRDGVLVVPGIRPAGAGAGDQARLATPAGALCKGASYLVVGRPITQASDPAAAADAIVKEMGRAIN